MKDPKALQLLQEVLAKTKASRISWEPTAKENEYFSILPSGHTITISSWNERDNWGNLLDEKTFSLVLADGRQELLQVTPDVEGTLTQGLELYELVRRQALHVDDAVDQILGELAKL